MSALRGPARESKPKLFAAPSRYLQGPGAMAQVGAEAMRLGRRALVVIDAGVQSIVGDTLLAGFGSATPLVAPFAGEVTDSNVAALLASVGAQPLDVIVAVGGGKALDAGKAVALRLALPVVSVPTIASTDAPASSGIAIYDSQHQLLRVDQLPANPACIVVDTEVIAKAPTRFLRAGIGDAIAKKFEAEGCWIGGGVTKHGTRPMVLARVIAEGAYQTLRKHAAGAVRAAERQQPDADLEATVEATILMSAMGFENGGLSIAHSVTRGLMAVRGTRDRLHGEHVAYGTLIHVLVEHDDEPTIEDLLGFYREIGLPSSLGDLGLPDPSPAEIALIAELTLKSPHIGNVSRPVSAQRLRSAVEFLQLRAVREPVEKLLQ